LVAVASAKSMKRYLPANGVSAALAKFRKALS